MLLALISLIAGALTVLAPCVLPLLPIIVGGSAAGDRSDRARPYVITAALALSIIGFTLLLKVSAVLAGVSQQALDIVSGTILIALGLVGVDPNLWDRLAGLLRLQALSDTWLRGASHSRRRLIGPILIGVSLGPVFASCSPTYAFILASVLSRNLLIGTLYLATYSLGLVAALLAVALAGRRLTARLGWAVDPAGLFRRGLGVVFILVGLSVLTGAQTAIEVWLANNLPVDEARLEQVLLKAGIEHKTPTSAGSVLNADTPAPSFVGLTNWINSPPLTIAAQRGKVVLVDFWTYSCINCIRSLPYVEKWYQTYARDGLVVVGVSTPEFAFEHNPANVAAAVKKFSLTYPVALDNNYDTWNAFNNNSWPADYLIDKQGHIRYTALGEGDYPTTETAIQQLLGVHAPLSTTSSNVPVTAAQTPETYFGTNREDSFAGQLAAGTATFHAPSAIPAGQWALSGRWNIGANQITSAGPSARLTMTVSAKDVYLVAGSSDSSAHTVTVGLPTAGNFGPDAPSGQVQVQGSRLYHIVSLARLGTTTLTLTVPAGVALYTFTFGS